MVTVAGNPLRNSSRRLLAEVTCSAPTCPAPGLVKNVSYAAANALGSFVSGSALSIESAIQYSACGEGMISYACLNDARATSNCCAANALEPASKANRASSRCAAVGSAGAGSAEGVSPPSAFVEAGVCAVDAGAVVGALAATAAVSASAGDAMSRAAPTASVFQAWGEVRALRRLKNLYM